MFCRLAKGLLFEKRLERSSKQDHDVPSVSFESTSKPIQLPVARFCVFVMGSSGRERGKSFYYAEYRFSFSLHMKKQKQERVRENLVCII